ncbi:MAG: hypothetical protein KBA66_11405 [Leptospiraceae bacterium]|nr:hypothetical protein [Leptospiraceae bacterium]
MEIEINLELSQKYHRKFSLSTYNPSFHSSLDVFINIKEFREGSYEEGIVIYDLLKGTSNKESFGLGVKLRHHAWIEFENKIIDVTLSDKSVKYFPCDYFALEKAEEIFTEYHSIEAPFFEYKDNHKLRNVYLYPEKWKSKFNDAIEVFRNLFNRKDISQIEVEKYVKSLYHERGLRYKIEI